MARTSEQFYNELGFEGMSELKTEERTNKELAYLKGLLRSGQHILDLGCGYGRYTIPLAEMGFEIDGIDLTPSLVSKARSIAKEHNLKVSFTIGDMRSLPFPNESYDVIICMWNTFSELYELVDQNRAIEEMLRVLRNYGFGIIEVRNHRASGVDQNYKIEGIDGMPSFRHTKKSLKELMTNLKIRNYKVFVDVFGGRNRLFLQFYKGS